MEPLQLSLIYDINIRPMDMSMDELRDGFLNLTWRLHAPRFVEQKSQRFREHLRAKVRGRENVRKLSASIPLSTVAYGERSRFCDVAIKSYYSLDD